METQQIQHNKQPDKEQSNRLRRRAVDESAIGSLLVFWGSLLILKEFGIIEKSVSTWPFPLAVFGLMLFVSAIYKLNKSRNRGEVV
jgi:hypothetical protein